jgi:hypothetical protein
VSLKGAGSREVAGLTKDARTPLMALIEWALRHNWIVIAFYGEFLLGGFLGKEPHTCREVSPCVLKKLRCL